MQPGEDVAQLSRPSLGFLRSDLRATRQAGDQHPWPGGPRRVDLAVEHAGDQPIQTVQSLQNVDFVLRVRIADRELTQHNVEIRVGKAEQMCIGMRAAKQLLHRHNDGGRARRGNRARKSRRGWLRHNSTVVEQPPLFLARVSAEVSSKRIACATSRDHHGPHWQAGTGGCLTCNRSAVGDRELNVCAGVRPLGDRLVPVSRGGEHLRE